jgi:hypothetical protein
LAIPGAARNPASPRSSRTENPALFAVMETWHHCVSAARHRRRHRSHLRRCRVNERRQDARDRQWIEAVGHRETPTPRALRDDLDFLDDLASPLAEPPPLAELIHPPTGDARCPHQGRRGATRTRSPILGPANSRRSSRAWRCSDSGERAASEAQTFH